MRGAAPFPSRQLYLWGCRGFNSAESRRSNERPVTSHKLVHLSHTHTHMHTNTPVRAPLPQDRVTSLISDICATAVTGVWWSCPSKRLRHELQPKEGPSMITQMIESYVAIINNVCSVCHKHLSFKCPDVSGDGAETARTHGAGADLSAPQPHIPSGAFFLWGWEDE